MLKLCDVKDATQSVWLVAPKVTIGRGNQCDLTLADASIAKLHAEILVDGEELELRNLAGKGQVAVNGKPVEGSCKLQRNDRVQLGERNLAVVDPKITRLKAAGASANAAWALRANHPAIVGRVFPVRETSVVGRSDECDLTFSMSHLSRRHARLEVREGLLFVVDLGSANGTYLNNQRVTECRVRRGDELRFDSLSFSVVGPADDIDKTTVRQAVTMPDTVRQSAALDQAMQRSRVKESGKVSYSSDSAPSQKYAGGSTTAGGSGWIWVAALVAAAAVAGYFWAQGQGLV
ncbi:FHA domain-containing protein [Microbulbifer hydrolyticus]|uniref:FHA domain-containing protein n=1 Tax=Microbulbifer hydrolyticus TaxID=48074 RepID=A0A6P1TDZ6_9GAMM|nr:FHA domain-containing protein [Microbulbifer hydrolyticus]MBB5210581.1 pSer/pThr/pTyr-binding forkhead associated (FHA) protein [Microbulbifer hydrolyticus]QHQ38952.1 FHA domain-containing protein [Microbulbifer hydrolyticus]